MRTSFVDEVCPPDDKDYSVPGMKCPKCGGKVVITHDVVDGLDLGFSVGCSRFCHYDGIHGTTFDTPEKDWYAIHYLSSKKKCVEKWNQRVKYLKEKEKNEHK